MAALIDANTDYRDIEAQAIINTEDQSARSDELAAANGDRRQEKRGLHKHEDYHVHEEKTLTIYKQIPVPYPGKYCQINFVTIAMLNVIAH